MKTAGTIPRWISVLFAFILLISLAAMGGAVSSIPETDGSGEAAPITAETGRAATGPATAEGAAAPNVPEAALAEVVVSGAAVEAAAALPAEVDPQSGDPSAAALIDAPTPSPILPPYDLKGAQAPDPDRLYVILTWKSDNPPNTLKGYNIYRVEVGAADELPGLGTPYDTVRKPYYEDYKVEAGHTYRYWVTAVSKGGEESKPSNTADVTVVKVAVPSTPTGFAAWVVDPGVSLDWDPNPEKDIAGYNVYVSRNPNSARKKINGSLVAANHYYLADGQADLCYWVSAVNRLGLESQAAMAKPQAVSPMIIEENDPSIETSGLWVPESYVGPTNGKIKVAGDAGARLQLKFTGSQVKLVVAKYWSCGSARVYLDGKEIAVINLYSESVTYNVVDLSVPGLPRGEHTLVIEALGAGNPQYPFNFVNVDCFEIR